MIFLLSLLFIILISAIVIFRVGFDEQGVSASTSEYVKEQQEAVICANNIYQQEKENNAEFNSQCLGTCMDFAVDIVHVPRTDEDNKSENQCESYRNGKVGHFIELDKDGKIVRLV